MYLRKQYKLQSLMSELILGNDTSLSIELIYNSITNDGFSKRTIELIDNYAKLILNGKVNLNQFNQQEHAGLCCAGEVLIGAYIVCCFAQASFRTSANAGASQTSVSNWKIDETQERLVQQWAEAKQLWFANAEADIELEYGSKIAQGAEAKVYYKQGDTSVIKMRTSIYATLGRALESIVLHNALFPETAMKLIGFTRDANELFRSINTQPYISCQRLATKQEIDDMVAIKGFTDNGDGTGVNYIGERLHLEDMHPANVFIDTISNNPVCIDCIVKFIRK